MSKEAGSIKEFIITKVGCHDKKRSINFHVHKSGEPANGITRRKVYMIVTNYKLKTKRKCPRPISSVSSKKGRASHNCQHNLG
jgi:hypothetical protein